MANTKESQAKKKDKITRKTSMGDVVSKHPEAAEVMLGKGLHCVGCYAAFMETVEQGAKAHGMNDDDIDNMLKEMNKAIEKEKSQEDKKSRK